MAKATPGENFTVLRAVLPGGWVIMSALGIVMCELLHLRPRSPRSGGRGTGWRRRPASPSEG